MRPVSLGWLGERSLRYSVLTLFAVVALGGVSVPTAFARASDCKPLEAVFYESSDWARLASGLAANASPCATYYVTIPALAADKTQMRPAAAAQVRTLGANFHALAEINYSAWLSWVSATGNSWYAAGVEARRRMAAAGFDVGAGDTWVVNEFSSAVRAGTGSARQNVRDLVRGPYDGDGTQPAAKGMVFVDGVSQNAVSFPQYKATMESWLQDENFWSDMSSYVSDFFQEVYGDVRNYAVAGQDSATRAAALNAYLQHPLALALATGAPPAETAAHNYLSAAYGSLANASWAWGSAYGWTQVGPDVMADYVSAQTYAMRLGGSTRIGFAWNPLNSMGLSNDDFVTQVAAVLARLAGAIHETDGGDPTQACEATGCAAVLGGATAVPGWSTFSQWTPTAANFSGAPVALTTGTPSGPISLQLQTANVSTTLPVASSVTISSSSHTGTFASDPGGPWSPTLTLALPPGSGSATFYAMDATAGSPTFTANLGGQAATQLETVAAPVQPASAATPPALPSARLASLQLSPQQGRLHLALQVVGPDGQPLQARLALAVLHDGSTIATASGETDATGVYALTARPWHGCYSIQLDALSAVGYVWGKAVPASSYCAQTLPAHVATAVFGRKNGRLHVAIRATDDAGRPLPAQIEFAVLRRGSELAATAGHTAGTGWLALTAPPKPPKLGCYRVVVRSLTSRGYRWDGSSPSERYCLQSRG